MARVIQLRGDTSANWTAANPVLADREFGIVTDQGTYKIGNGVDAWNTLGAVQLTPEMQTIVLNEPVDDPTPPVDGKLVLYAKKVGGRMMPKFIGSSGLDTVLQPGMFNNNIMMIGPAQTTTLTTFGCPITTQTGTLSHPAIVAGSGMRQSIRRAQLLSAATAASVAMMRTTYYQCYRGDAPGLGGFFFVVRFAVPLATPDSHFQIGLMGSVSLTLATLPSAQINSLLIGWDPTDPNLQFMSCNATAGVTKVDLGSNFPKGDANAIYDFTMYAAPNSDHVNWRVLRVDTGDVVEGTVNTNLPAGSQLLAYHAKLNNNTTAASSQMDFMRLYIETDN